MYACTCTIGQVDLLVSYNAIPLRTAFSQFFTFLLLSSHLLNAIVCIIKSFLCHNIKQAMSYHIMEFYVTTCRMSRLSRHPYLKQLEYVTKGHIARLTILLTALFFSSFQLLSTITVFCSTNNPKPLSTV